MSDAEGPRSTPVDLREDGILWAINRSVFHPRGFALGVDETGALTLYGDGDEPWVYAESMAIIENDRYRAFEAALARVRAG